MKSSNFLKSVAEHYEEYPYPERDPEDEKKRLYSPMPDCLDRVNYYCFSGEMLFNSDFRVLVAGGGTGDTVIFMAEQLRDAGSEVVCLDISTASMEIARKRAAVRGLTNIRWVHGSLLDLPTMELDNFDYINCSGVLHHLENPKQGLAALNSALKENGAMSIMVYGKYGRTAIYMIQELMRRINSGESNMGEKVNNCHKVLESLPVTHWFSHEKKQSPNWEYNEPIELYDLFLHSQDRAYSIPELYEFVEAEGLHIMHMLRYGNDARGNNIYDPGSYINDKDLLKNIKTFSTQKQQAIAELLYGGIGTHTFYASRTSKPPPSAENLDNIPHLDINSNSDDYSLLHSLVSNSQDNVEIKKGLHGEYVIRFAKSQLTEGIFEYMDGKNTLGTIFKKIISSHKYKKLRPTIPKLQKEFMTIYSAFSTYDWMFLRSSKATPPLTVQEMQSRVK